MAAVDSSVGGDNGMLDGERGVVSPCLSREGRIGEEGDEISDAEVCSGGTGGSGVEGRVLISQRLVPKLIAIATRARDFFCI